MANNDYQMIRYDPRFQEQLIALQSHLWGTTDAARKAYLEWKYFQNPYTDVPVIYLLVQGERLVGMVGLIVSCWEFGPEGKHTLQLCVADLLIDPAYQKLGLFRLIWRRTTADLRNTDYTWLFVLSGHVGVTQLVMRIGYKAIGRLDKIQRVSRPGLMVRAEQKLRRQIPSMAMVLPRRSFARLDRKTRSMSNQGKISVELTPRVGEMAELVRRLPWDGRIRHVRDETYFSWRYQNPLSEYRYIYWGREPLEGYLVLQTARHNYGVTTWANIVDWEASTPEIQAALLQTAINLGEFEKLTIWAAHHPESSKALLSDTGFQPVTDIPDGLAYPTVLVNPIRKELPQEEWQLGGRHLLDGDNWDIRGIYSDGF